MKRRMDENRKGKLARKRINEGNFSRNIERFDTNCEVLSLSADEYEEVEFRLDPHEPSKYSWLADELRAKSHRYVKEIDIGLDDDESEVAAFVVMLDGDGEALVGLVTRIDNYDYSDEEVAELVKRAEAKANKVLASIEGQSVAKPDKFEDYWTGLKKLPRRNTDESRKVTLTLGQLRKLVRESIVKENEPIWESVNPKFRDLMNLIDGLDDNDFTPKDMDGGRHWNKGKWNVSIKAFDNWYVISCHDGSGQVAAVNYGTKQYDLFNYRAFDPDEVEDFLYAINATGFTPIGIDASSRRHVSEAVDFINEGAVKEALFAALNKYGRIIKVDWTDYGFRITTKDGDYTIKLDIKKLPDDWWEKKA